MNRTVNLGSKPDLQSLTVTPNRTCADSLGVPAVTLEALARQALPEGSVAAPVQSRRLLVAAVREVLGESDPLGFARFFGPAVRELLRLDADLERVVSCGGRLTRLADVTRAFKCLLSERGLVDAAQVFFEAARVTERSRVTVTGYPRLGLGELVFLDALAADGSQLVLPYADDAPVHRERRGGGVFWKLGAGELSVGPPSAFGTSGAPRRGAALPRPGGRGARGACPGQGAAGRGGRAGRRLARRPRRGTLWSSRPRRGEGVRDRRRRLLRSAAQEHPRRGFRRGAHSYARGRLRLRGDHALFWPTP